MVELLRKILVGELEGCVGRLGDSLYFTIIWKNISDAGAAAHKDGLVQKLKNFIEENFSVKEKKTGRKSSK